ncbi:phosphatase PAP2 family protein [Peribacillus glennii]|uniref:Phosphatase PAP2 family protein n=1 Tax=Peribacillus glennii TaxID=2303991 RepID=A0A372LJP4_9BACI|nr:phosphatase PAP2 family protein [Peribacillus glennii]
MMLDKRDGVTYNNSRQEDISNYIGFYKRSFPDLHRFLEASGYSFPSGNATMAMALYGFLLFILCSKISSKLGRVVVTTFCIGMILSIGISRIYMGVIIPVISWRDTFSAPSG